MACQHDTFEASVDVTRLTETEDSEPTHFVADVHVRCVECGEPFGFAGLPAGVDPTRPTTSVDATEARLPLLTPSQMKLQQLGLSG